LFHRSPSGPVQLTSGPTDWFTPIPGRDAKKIFAHGVVSRGELVRLDVKSNQFQPFLGGLSAEFVTFSPDGKSTAYVTFPGGILWRASRDGSNPIQLTDPPWYPLNPRWSPDSANIVFNQLNSQNRLQSYLIPSQGGAPRPLIPEDNGIQIDANYSPDGRKIVFASLALEGETYKSTLRVFDTVSHEITTLAGSKDKWSPRWSPNGRFIAGLNGTAGLSVFDVKTQRWSELLAEKCGWPTWSMDSKFIYFLHAFGSEEAPGVYRVRVSGGPAERVVDLKGFRFTGSVGHWMGLDPTGTPMLIRDTGTDDIYSLTLEQK
jgi:hypothetical protein